MNEHYIKFIKTIEFEKHVVLIADGKPNRQGGIYYHDDIEYLHKPIPVLFGFDHIIPPVGTAMISLDGNDVLAHIKLTATLQELDRLVNLVPVVGGEQFKRGGRQKIFIKQIGLAHCNADPRIEQLSPSRYTLMDREAIR